MTTALVWLLPAAAVLCGLWLRNRHLYRQRNAAATLAEQWESIAARAQAERNHLAERLSQSRRILAQTMAEHAAVTAERDRVIARLLIEVDLTRREGQAASQVALARVAALTAQLSELLVAARDEQDAELQEIVRSAS